MRNLISILLIVFMTLGMLMQHADAKRFGGGRSFGFQRSASSFTKPHAAPIQPGPAAQRPGLSRWLAPLAGLAAGGLLAYLFMGHGLASGLLSWLAIAAVAFMILNLLRGRKLQPAAAMRDNNMNMSNANTAFQFAPKAANSAAVYPAGFDADNFLREAKVQFIRLQAAYDSKNLVDLREFTAPEVFGEIQMQLEERGDAPNHTEVVKLDAELLDVGVESQATIASVRFSGLVREEQNTAPVSINEIWHLRKYSSNPTWVVAGLQQVN